MFDSHNAYLFLAMSLQIQPCSWLLQLILIFWCTYFVYFSTQDLHTSSIAKPMYMIIVRKLSSTATEQVVREPWCWTKWEHRIKVHTHSWLTVPLVGSGHLLHTKGQTLSSSPDTVCCHRKIASVIAHQLSYSLCAALAVEALMCGWTSLVCQFCHSAVKQLPELRANLRQWRDGYWHVSVSNIHILSACFFHTLYLKEKLRHIKGQLLLLLLFVQAWAQKQMFTKCVIRPWNWVWEKTAKAKAILCIHILAWIISQKWVAKQITGAYSHTHRHGWRWYGGGNFVQISWWEYYFIFSDLLSAVLLGWNFILSGCLKIAAVP